MSRRELLARGGVAGAALGAGVLLDACGGASRSASTPTSTSGGKPRSGGVLRMGMSDDTGGKLHDPQNVVGGLDIPLSSMLYDTPVVAGVSGELVLSLAEEVSHNKDATQWTVRLHKGVEFQNGKRLGAEDVMFTARRALSKTHPTRAATNWSWVDLNQMKKLDPVTVRFTLPQPYSIVFQQFYYTQILPVGFDANHPVGSGPWKLVSADPGQGAVVARFENYWGGKPNLDQIHLIQFSDPAALLNGLLGGQLDAIDNVDNDQLGSIKANSSLQVSVAGTTGGNTRQINMDTTQHPFTDNRVRQAMRLLANRPQMIEQVFPGQAAVANDVWAAKGNGDYDTALPQRVQDIAQAKSLLKQAGVANDAFQLATVSAYSGMAAAAQVYASEATAGGVKVAVSQKDPSTYFSTDYMTYPFWVSAGGGSAPYLINVATYLAPNALIPETKWRDPQFDALWDRALSTADAKQRLEVEFEMQRIEWERGGTIIWSWPNQLSAFSKKFGGITIANKSGIPFDNYNFVKAYRT